MTTSQEYINLLKTLLAERYSSSDLVDILEIPVEWIIDEFFDQILDNKELINNVR